MVFHPHNLESCSFPLLAHPRQRQTRISPWKHLFGHEQTPQQILLLPGPPQTRDLQLEQTVVVQHVLHLVTEPLLVGDPDVLAHFHATYSVLFLVWQIPSVHDVDTHFALYPQFDGFALDEVGLFLAEGHTRGSHVVVLCRVVDQSTPAAPKVQMLQPRLHLHHLADLVQLPLLSYLQVSLFVREEYSAALEAPAVQEPPLKVVSSVLHVRYFFFIPPLEQFREEIQEKLLDDALAEAHGEEFLAQHECALHIVVFDVQFLRLESFDRLMDRDFDPFVHHFLVLLVFGDQPVHLLFLDRGRIHQD